MLEKDSTKTTPVKKKMAYETLSHMNIGAKVLNEILTNLFQC